MSAITATIAEAKAPTPTAITATTAKASPNVITVLTFLQRDVVLRYLQNRLISFFKAEAAA